MPATLTKPGFDQQTFEAFLHARHEPDWLVEQRRDAWQTFSEKDWPQRSDEEWIRTDIRLFKLNQFALPVVGDAAERHRGRSLQDGYRCVALTISMRGRWPSFCPARWRASCRDERVRAQRLEIVSELVAQ